MKKISEELSQNLLRSRVCHDESCGLFPLTSASASNLPFLIMYLNGPGESVYLRKTLITCYFHLTQMSQNLYHRHC